MIIEIIKILMESVCFFENKRKATKIIAAQNIKIF